MTTRLAIGLTSVFLLAAATPAWSQDHGRLQIGTVIRAERVFAEAGAGGTVPIAGVAAVIRLSRSSSAEVEVTRAGGVFARSYEGWFISYATNPNATREEIEAAAPTARRTDRYDPGIGWSAAWTARSDSTHRISIGGRVGVSARRYLRTSSYDVLTIPAGIDPARVARDFATETGHRVRGGLLLGTDIAVRLTYRVRLIPEARFVYGGPARVGNKHRELAGGIRLLWMM
jgi:hypothetical protein